MASKFTVVLGAGSWGTALAIALARNGHQVYLWDINTDLINALNRDRVNERYIPSVNLPHNLLPIKRLEELPTGIQMVINAVPCHGLRSSLQLLKSFAGIKLCLACKGFEPGTQKFNHEVVKEEFDICMVSLITAKPCFLWSCHITGEQFLRHLQKPSISFRL